MDSLKQNFNISDDLRSYLFMLSEFDTYWLVVIQKGLLNMINDFENPDKRTLQIFWQNRDVQTLLDAVLQLIGFTVMDSQQSQ